MVMLMELSADDLCRVDMWALLCAVMLLRRQKMTIPHSNEHTPLLSKTKSSFENKKFLIIIRVFG